MKLRNTIRNGTFGLALAAFGCMGGSDSYTNDNAAEEEARTAIAYVEHQLQDRGYTTERDVSAYFLNVDNGQVIANNWDLHAFNGTRESYWEATAITPAVNDLVTVSKNNPASYPNQTLWTIPEGTSNADLDSMVIDSDL